MSNSRPPKHIVERRKAARRANTKGPSLSRSYDWKFWAIGVPGLVVGALALWLAVEDRPTISMGPQMDANNLLSTQVKIVNEGVLPIENVSIEIYVKHAEISRGNVLNDDLAGDYTPPTGILRPGEPKITDLSRMIHGDWEYYALDIALIAHFHPMWAPFWNRTRIFRFTTAKLANGNAILEQVPAENIEDDYLRIKSRSISN
jgi:hypothetical protein